MKLFRNKRLLGGLIILVVMVLLARFSGIEQYINIAWFKAQRLYLQQMVHTYYAQSVLLYIIVYICSVALSLPIAAILTIVGGFLFGTIQGALYADIGATTGAMIAFLMVRYLVGNVLQKHYSTQLARLNGQIKMHGTSYLLTIHFIAFIPFFLINILAGLTQISLWTFFWTTAMGILPGSLVYAFAGRQLTTIKSVGDIFSFNVILAFIFLAILAFIPVIIKYVKR